MRRPGVVPVASVQLLMRTSVEFMSAPSASSKGKARADADTLVKRRENWFWFSELSRHCGETRRAGDQAVCSAIFKLLIPARNVYGETRIVAQSFKAARAAPPPRTTGGRSAAPAMRTISISRSPLGTPGRAVHPESCDAAAATPWRAFAPSRLLTFQPEHAVDHPGDTPPLLRLFRELLPDEAAARVRHRASSVFTIIRSSVPCSTSDFLASLIASFGQSKEDRRTPLDCP